MSQAQPPHVYAAKVGSVGRHAGFREPLNFEAGVFVANDPPGLHEVHNLAHYRGMILAISFFEDDGTWNTVEGSAVMIGPGIAATATHVFEALTEEIKRRQVRMVLSSAVGDDLRVWFPRGVHPVDGTDVTIIEVELISDMPAARTFVQASLTTRLPPVGEAVMLVGFRKSERHVAAEKGTYFPRPDGGIRFGLAAYCSVGRVLQHNLEHAASIARGLTITTECEILGGMSGGAAFDAEGRLFGILSASTNAGEGEVHSTVSLIVQALGVRALPSAVPGYPDAAPRILDNPRIYIEGRERVSVLDDPERLEIDWE